MVILKIFMLHLNYFPWKFWLVLCTFYWISSHVKYPVRHLFPISYFRSLQRRHNFGKQLSAKYFLGVLYSCHLLIFMAEEGWGEKEICIEGVNDGQSERKGKGRGFYPTLSPMVYSNSKANMAGWRNYSKLITITSLNKTV